jgi:serine/threonine protein kinase
MGLPLVYLNKGSYGIVMRTILDSNIVVVKQQRVQLLNNDTNSLDYEINFINMTCNINDDIFIKIIKNELSSINLAKTINKNIPLFEGICLNDYGYIYMEWMELGDLFNFLVKKKQTSYFDITGILGCYLNGLYILHNKFKLIHGDLSPLNILVRYVGPDYKQKIIYDDKQYNINTSGYNFKIADFGLTEYLEKTIYNRTTNNTTSDIYINHIYRDYLLLFFLYFNKDIFYNYDIFSNIIDTTVNMIKEELFESYGITDKYNKHFIEKYTFNSVCYFMDTFMEIDNDNPLLFEIPKILLNEFIEKVEKIDII